MPVKRGAIMKTICLLDFSREFTNRSSARLRPTPVIIRPMQIGNTNSRYHFSLGAKGFLNAWSKGAPAHHCTNGVGHIGDKIEKPGSLLGIEVNRVC